MRQLSDRCLKTQIIQITAAAALLSAYTFVPILAREHLGISEIYIPLIVGGDAAASFIASYVFGRAGDIYGRRIIIRAGLFLATLSFSLLLVATSLETLFIVRLMNGFCVGMYPGALAAYAYESKIKMGRFATWGAAGWGIGTLFAGYAAGFNIYYAFVISTVFLAFAFVSALTLPNIQRVPMRVPLFPKETFKRNIHVYVAIFIRQSSASAIWALWPLFLFDLGGDTFTISVVQALSALSQVVFMALITDRVESKKLIAIGLIASVVTFASFPFARDILEILPSQVLVGFTWACLYVGSLKYITENNEDRSTAVGLLQSVFALAGIIGPILAATLYFVWPAYWPAMFFAAAMAMLAFALFQFSNRHKSGSEIVGRSGIPTKTS